MIVTLEAIILALFCVFYGYAEWEMISRSRNHSTGKKIILGIFSKYHIFMFFMFLAAATLFNFENGWRMMPAMVLLEDYSYRWAKGVWIQPGSWVDMKLGGFHFFGAYVPWTYVLLAVSAFLLVHFHKF